MTKRIAIIGADGRVSNIAVYPDDFVPDGVKTVEADDKAAIGGRFAGGRFEPPQRPDPTPEPESRAYLALKALAARIGPDAETEIDNILTKGSN